MKSKLRIITTKFLFIATSLTVLITELLITELILDTGATIALADDNQSTINEASKPIGIYKDLDNRHGTFNDGQAAIWDLNITDHFHYFGPDARARGYKPEQPIKFSHVTHVQVNRMECQYCHWTANKTSYAAIPEVETCMGCHTIIQGQTPEQQKEIAKIKTYWDKGEPIPWQKVHVMPDHVHFNHKRHVKAGVSCQECHGIVPNMQVVERTSSMKMGWCIECHRQRASSIDCYTCHY